MRPGLVLRKRSGAGLGLQAGTTSMAGSVTYHTDTRSGPRPVGGGGQQLKARLVAPQSRLGVARRHLNLKLLDLGAAHE